MLQVQLFSARGKRGFYERLGFVVRPDDGPVWNWAGSTRPKSVSRNARRRSRTEQPEGPRSYPCRPGFQPCP